MLSQFPDLTSRYLSPGFIDEDSIISSICLRISSICLCCSGAIIAGIVMGVIESWIGGFFPIIWQEVAAFVLMIVVLLVRPAGLFGRHDLRLG